MEYQRLLFFNLTPWTDSFASTIGKGVATLIVPVYIKSNQCAFAWLKKLLIFKTNLELDSIGFAHIVAKMALDTH